MRRVRRHLQQEPLCRLRAHRSCDSRSGLSRSAAPQVHLRAQQQHGGLLEPGHVLGLLEDRRHSLPGRQRLAYMYTLQSIRSASLSAFPFVCVSLSLSLCLSRCVSVCLCLTHTPAGAGTYFRTQALYNAKTKLYVLWANAVGCLKATCPNATCAAYAMVRFQCSAQCG